MGYGYLCIFIIWSMKCFCTNPMLMMMVILILQPLCSIALYKLTHLNNTPFYLYSHKQ